MKKVNSDWNICIIFKNPNTQGNCLSLHYEGEQFVTLQGTSHVFFSYIRSCYKRTHDQIICTAPQMQSGNFPLHLRGFIDGSQLSSVCRRRSTEGKTLLKTQLFLCFQIDQDPNTIRELRPLHFSLHICNSALHHHSTKVSIGSGGWLYPFFSWLYISMFKFMHIYCLFNENIEPHFFRKCKRTFRLCMFTHSVI